MPPKYSAATTKRLTVIAAARNAVYRGRSTRHTKYGVFTFGDHRVELIIDNVLAGQWPEDIQAYAAKQVKRRAAKGAPYQAALKSLGAEHQAVLLDEAWHGRAHWYAFKLNTGRIVHIRGSKLLTAGWPEDLDAYLQWSSARQSKNPLKSREDRYAEFCREVAGHDAEVITSAWLGSRVPHEVRLPDGSVRWLKPNQLKYFGWPKVPSVELARLMDPHLVEALPPKNPGEPPLFKVSLVGSPLYLQGGYKELLGLWNTGVEHDLRALGKAATDLGYELCSAVWRGITAAYLARKKNLNLVERVSFENWLKPRQAESLSRLRRIGARLGAQLLSATFEGKEASYAWQRHDGVIHASAAQLRQQTRSKVHFAKLREKLRLAGLDADVLSTEWQGMCAEYLWRLPDGRELRAKPSQLKALCAGYPADIPRHKEKSILQMGAMPAMHVLSRWASNAGLTLLSTTWIAERSDYLWALPDGSQVEASFKKMRNCTNAVLRQRTTALHRQHGSTLLASECPSLLKRLRTSRSQ